MEGRCDCGAVPQRQSPPPPSSNRKEQNMKLTKNQIKEKQEELVAKGIVEVA